MHKKNRFASSISHISKPQYNSKHHQQYSKSCHMLDMLNECQKSVQESGELIGNLRANEILNNIKEVKELTFGNIEKARKRDINLKDKINKAEVLYDASCAFKQESQRILSRHRSKKALRCFIFSLILTMSVALIFILVGLKLSTQQSLTANGIGYAFLILSLVLIFIIIFAVLFHKICLKKLQRFDTLNDKSLSKTEINSKQALQNNMSILDHENEESIQNLKIKQQINPISDFNHKKNSKNLLSSSSTPTLFRAQNNIKSSTFGKKAYKKLDFIIPEDTKQLEIMKNLEMNIKNSNNVTHLFNALVLARVQLYKKSFWGGGIALNYVKTLIKDAKKIYAKEGGKKAYCNALNNPNLM